jgi:hypothetical protein
MWDLDKKWCSNHGAVIEIFMYTPINNSFRATFWSQETNSISDIVGIAVKYDNNDSDNMVIAQHDGFMESIAISMSGNVSGELVTWMGKYDTECGPWRSGWGQENCKEVLYLAAIHNVAPNTDGWWPVTFSYYQESFYVCE